jgi:hypothetical protein
LNIVISVLFIFVFVFFCKFIIVVLHPCCIFLKNLYCKNEIFDKLFPISILIIIVTYKHIFIWIEQINKLVENIDRIPIKIICQKTMLTDNKFSTIRRHNTKQQENYHQRQQQPPQWPMPLLQQDYRYLRVQHFFIIFNFIYIINLLNKKENMKFGIK